MLYNILQTWNTTGQSTTMLGCNVDKLTAEKYLKYYQDGDPDINKRRIALGNPPLDVRYEIIEATGEFQDWLPDRCKSGNLPFVPGYHASNRRFT